MTKLLSPKEFAAELNITLACVRRWIFLRRIEVVRVGRLVRIRTEERDRIISEGLVPAKPRSGDHNAK